MNCPYCNHTKTYLLKTKQRKCSLCQKKFSPTKIQREHDIIDCFCNNLSAKKCAERLQLNYITVKNRYELFRSLLVNYLEDLYNQHQVEEYDEYIYLPKTKKKIQRYIFDAQNFLTFVYDTTKVYNLLMPNLNRYKTQFLKDGLDEIYFKEFSKFMMFNKIAKFNKQENTITKFWNFFEEFILKYKGINNENFIYYLKECEFKFNYDKYEAKEILLQLLKKYDLI